MFGNKSKRRAGKIPVEFVMAAGSGKNDPGAPGNGFVQHQIGGGIAGVKRHDQCGRLRAFIGRDIPAKKMKPRKAEGAGRLLAIVNDIPLEIHAGHFHFIAENVGKIVINGKGKIAFSAAKIADADLPLWQIGERIPHQFQKAVDLPEFRPFLSKCALPRPQRPA